MIVSMTLNGKKIAADISPDMTLYKFVREHGCYSVKCGCETTNCGLCTVFLDGKPVLSCAVPGGAEPMAIKLKLLKACRKRPRSLARFIADQGAEQCGFCNPGMIMNAIALFRENPEPTDDEIKQLSGRKPVPLFRL